MQDVTLSRMPHDIVFFCYFLAFFLFCFVASLSLSKLMRRKTRHSLGAFRGEWPLLFKYGKIQKTKCKESKRKAPIQASGKRLEKRRTKREKKMKGPFREFGSFHLKAPIKWQTEVENFFFYPAVCRHMRRQRLKLHFKKLKKLEKKK